MSFSITDTLSNLFNTTEVSLIVYAFRADTFGGVDPQQYTVPPTTEAAAHATADASGNVTLSVPAHTAYHLATQSVLNPGTWYWSYDRLVDSALTPTFAGTPTAVAGANNGTTPPAPVVATTATDARGTLTFGSGGSAAAGSQVVVTLKGTYASAPEVELESLNDATVLLVPYVNVTTTTFTIKTDQAPTASQANTVYSIGWRLTA